MKALFVLLLLLLVLAGCTETSTEEKSCGDGVCSELFGEGHNTCPADCKTLTQGEIAASDKVLISTAVDTNDYLLCEKVVGRKDLCYGGLWNKKSCSTLEEKRNDCYFEIAESTLELPENIVYSSYQLTISERSDICLYILTTEKAKECFMLFGINIESDLNACLITAGENREATFQCYIQYAVRSKDVSACNNIDENFIGPSDRWQCNTQVNSFK